MLPVHLEILFDISSLNMRALWEHNFVHSVIVRPLLSSAVASYLSIITRFFVQLRAAFSIDSWTGRNFMNSVYFIKVLSMSFHSGILRLCYFWMKSVMFAIVMERQLLTSAHTLFAFSKVNKLKCFHSGSMFRWSKQSLWHCASLTNTLCSWNFWS